MDPIDGDILNLSDAQTRQKLVAHLYACKGLHEVTVKPWKGTRRQRANRYHFGVVVKSLKNHFAESGQHYHTLLVHDYLKLNCLGTDIVDGHGEVISVVPGTSHNLSIPDFSAFENRCIEHIFDRFGIECPSPELYYAEPL